MNEFESITNNTSVVKIADCLDKVYKKIVDLHEKKLIKHHVKEIDLLKNQCKSEIVPLSVMSCQTFVRLVKNGILDSNNIIATFVSLLTNASPIQCTVITESIVAVLLINFKYKLKMLKKNVVYQSAFGLKIKQHPIITLIQNPTVNMNDIANKINGICHHDDLDIAGNSIEYLRPVYLYILCNPNTYADAKSIWTNLLHMSKTNKKARCLVMEILSWSKITTSQNCLFTSILLMDAIEHFQTEENFQPAVDLSVCFVVVINNMLKFGIDPRPSLNCVLSILQAAGDTITQNYYNVYLILLAQSLHSLTPIYLPNLLRILVYIIVQKRAGHHCMLNMCLDGIIHWMSQTTFIPDDGIALSHEIIRQILKVTKPTSNTIANEQIEDVTPSTPVLSSPHIETSKIVGKCFVRNYHPDIAIAMDLAVLVESFDESEFKDIFSFVDNLNLKFNPTFCQRLHLFLRALFLSPEPATDCWCKIYQVIMEIIRVNPAIAYDFLMTYIFKLANEYNPEIQIELLRGLPSFAVSKDNVPMILNTIRNFTTDNTTFSMDIYLRLWRVEPRTYPFLIKLLAQPLRESNNSWEHEIAKSYTIREICHDNPDLHGSDMVAQLSTTFNSFTNEDGDLATSLALDALTILCDSNTVNMASTWRVLRNKFINENRPQSLKSLHRFFAHAPHLQTPTLEYDYLVDDALRQLWQTICRNDVKPDIISSAFAALKDYELGSLLTLRYIPAIFCKDVLVKNNDGQDVQEFTDANGREVMDFRRGAIPGECWVQLLLKIRPDCIGSAADLIGHLISNEINYYRGGIYRLPEGRPEPRKLQGLHLHSPLKAIVGYLGNPKNYNAKRSSSDDNDTNLVITNALRSISKKFPKPIPPFDWSCLKTFFNISFEARKYCLMIVKNQLPYSISASNLLETFLAEFEPNCFEEDLLFLFTVLPDISFGINLTVLKIFVEKIVNYCFKESQLNSFTEGCLFDKFLESVKYVFQEKTELPEVLDFYTMIIERYMDSMDIDSKVFQRYTEVVSALNVKSIDTLTSPATWWETPIGKLKKATIIRSYLVLYNTKLDNPLKWLNPIIDAYFQRSHDEIKFFFQHLVYTLYAFNNDERTCKWMMEMFLHIQGLLADSSKKDNIQKVPYLLDIFILTVDVLSGCAVLLGNMDIVATQPDKRLHIFPESMQYLCEHAFWKEEETKIYEFLYNLYKNPSIPKSYANAFKDTILCSRNNNYFDSKNVWTKYVGLLHK